MAKVALCSQVAGRDGNREKRCHNVNKMNGVSVLGVGADGRVVLSLLACFALHSAAAELY